MIQTLIENNSFNGKYVAMKSFKDHSVVGSGDSPQEAHKKAVQKGYPDPVVTFVPTKGIVQIY